MLVVNVFIREWFMSLVRKRPESNRPVTTTTAPSRPTDRHLTIWRAMGIRSIGVALLLVGLLVAVSTAGAGSGTGTGPATPAIGSPVVNQPPPDAQPVQYQPCDVPPRDYDELMAMIVSAGPESYAPPPSSLTPRSLPGGHYLLPDGPAPAPETVQTLVRLLGTFENCSPLQRAALRPDDLLVRAAFGEDGARTIAGWWRDAHPAATVATPDPAIRVGDATIYQLYDFRTIDATHVAAYVELSGEIRLGFNPAAGTYQPTWEQAGYIVFTQGPDGRWLVDSFVSPLGSVVDTLFPEGAATPVP